MSAIEIGVAINIAINLGALGYAFGSLGARVKRNEKDIGQHSSLREEDIKTAAKERGILKGEQQSGHRRLRGDLKEVSDKVIRLEGIANGKKVPSGSA